MELLGTVISDIETQGQQQSLPDAWRAWDYTKQGTNTVTAGKGQRVAFTLQAQGTRVEVRIQQEWLAGLQRFDLGAEVYLSVKNFAARVRPVGDSFLFYIRERTWDVRAVQRLVMMQLFETARINFFNSLV
jgi:hypothetical protein